jgi:hypothetical protein
VSSKETTSFADPELVELFADEPELLAIADAVAETAGVSTPQRALSSASRRRVRRPSLLWAAALVATAMAVALFAPWHRSSGTLADLALAAIGSQPVVHVVMDVPTGAGLVDIESGDARPLMQRDEIWYDADRSLRRDVTSSGAAILDIVLMTPQGSFSSHGIVYDCAWIAAHPAAATRAGVSCNASGDNGTKPRVIARPRPTLDPGLAGFADGYRQALASGEAREAGSGELNGVSVDWLVFPTSDGGTERVALDQRTHKPVMLLGRGFSARIVSIETIPYDPGDFARPKPSDVLEQPSSAESTDGAAVALSGAAIAASYPRAVWAGPEVAGLPLVRVEQVALSASFASGAPSQTGPGLELVYGTLNGARGLDGSRPYVEILEAPEPALTASAGALAGKFPPTGSLYVNPLSGEWGTGDSLGIGATVIDGVYLVIQTQGTGPQTLLEVARALSRP